MKDTEILEQLLELAYEAGFEVRIAGRDARGAGDLPLASGVCRVKGVLWIVLSGDEPVGRQIRVLGRALALNAAALVEDRFLPPAVREAIDDPGGG